MFPSNSECLIGISDAFSAFVYGYPSSCPRAHCTSNKSVPTLRYTRRHGPIIIYTRLPAGGTYYPICMFPTNSECLIGISDTFSAFVYGYPSSCPYAHCTPNKSVPTLPYPHRPGPMYTGHACRHLLSAVPWISKNHLFARR